MLQGKILRVARPTDRLDQVVRFYTEGLGLHILYQFENHDGFDGVMVGMPGEAYHFEFTHHRGHSVGRAPTQDNLIVFYLPEPLEWQRTIEQMNAAGYKPVRHPRRSRGLNECDRLKGGCLHQGLLTQLLELPSFISDILFTNVSLHCF